MSLVHEQCLGLPTRGLQHEVRPSPIEQLRSLVDQFLLPPACPQVDDLVSRLCLSHESHLCAKTSALRFTANIANMSIQRQYNQLGRLGCFSKPTPARVTKCLRPRLAVAIFSHNHVLMSFADVTLFDFAIWLILGMIFSSIATRCFQVYAISAFGNRPHSHTYRVCRRISQAH